MTPSPNQHREDVPEESGESGLQFPLVVDEAIQETFGRIESTLMDNTKMKRSDMQKLGSALKNMKIEVVPGVMMTMEEMKGEEMQRNVRIWKEVMIGNSYNISKMTLLPVVVARKWKEYFALLDLSSLKELSMEAARELKKCRGTLTLNGLKKISVEVARELKDYEGDKMQLDGIERISVEVARELKEYKGEIFLNVFYDEPELMEVMKELSTCKGHINYDPF